MDQILETEQEEETGEGKQRKLLQPWGVLGGKAGEGSSQLITSFRVS